MNLLGLPLVHFGMTYMRAALLVSGAAFFTKGNPHRSMKRNDPVFDGLFHGPEGLWSAVLLDILNEIEDPTDRASYEHARRIVMEPENGCLPFIAAALEISMGQLHKKIIRYLKEKRVTIS